MKPADLNVKERVRDATDIVALISASTTLRPQGHLQVGHCPWHDDTRPSLKVNPERQSWKCWVCNIGGDVFDFVMKRDAMGFRDALELLADQAGITLQRGRNNPSGVEKRDLLRVLAWAERQFAEYLRDAGEAVSAREYLEQRNISEHSARHFRLGFSPNEWDWLLRRARREGITDEQLQLTGLTSFSESSKRAYDRFRGRLLFSIRDEQGRTVGFGGRILPSAADDAGPKYVNSPETRWFAKSELLYALDVARDEIRRAQHLIVVEGYTDVIMAHQFGITNVVAVLGTALGDRHLRLIQRFADRVTLVLDGDDAGQRRTNEILDLFLRHGVDLRIATIPKGFDPCDFLLTEGKQAFQTLVDSAAGAIFHRIHVATRGVDMRHDLHAANRALEEILRSLALVGKDSPADQSRQRLKERQVLSLLARQFDVPEWDLVQRVQVLRRESTKVRAREAATPYAITPPLALNDWDRALLELCIACPELVPQVLQEIPVEELHSEDARSVYDLLSQLVAGHESWDFHSLMLRLDDPVKKSLLVELDEEAANRSELKLRPEECLREVIEAYQHRRMRRECRVDLKRLDDETTSEDEKLDALEKILQRRRLQQGL